MAASMKRLSVLFLVLVLAHSQVQARESKFFTKVTHSTNVATGDGVEEKKRPQIEIPVAAPEYSLAPSPAPANVEKEYGYGLYGHDSDMLPPARDTYTPVTTTTTDVNEKETPTTPATATTDKDAKFEEQFVRKELSGQTFQTGYTNNNNYNYNNNNGYSYNENYNNNNNGYSTTENYNSNNGYSNTENYNNNNNGYSNKYNYNGYANTRETNGFANKYKTNALTSTYSTTGQSENYNTNGYSGNYNNNGYGTERQGMSDTRYMENGKYSYNNGYGTERQGMSDTRYMENGKYYYKVESDNSNLNGYEPEKAATGNHVNYDENSSNSNEFDTMEEYYKKQGYQESQEGQEP